MKTYILTVSKLFPKTHIKSGLPTGFIEAIVSKQKKHTIRGNYLLWEKRINEIKKGNAILSIRYWSEKPYRSKQVEVFILDQESDIGIQKLEFKKLENNEKILLVDNNRRIPIFNLSQNDFLSVADFTEWFKNYNLNETMAIIHFTKERY